MITFLCDNIVHACIPVRNTYAERRWRRFGWSTMVRASSFFTILCLAAAFGCTLFSSDVYGFQNPSHGRSRKMTPLLRMSSSSEGGADIDAEGAVVSADAGSNPFMSARGKVNEIDFCIAPADVSLSRSYKDAEMTTTTTTTTATSTTTTAAAAATTTTTTATSTMSLTRFLNNASNRAVRRILLARSWPSPEALNRSLRQVMSQQKQQQQQTHQQLEEAEEEEQEQDDSTTTNEQQQEKKRRRRSLVPRPILKVIMRQRDKRVKKQQQEEEEEDEEGTTSEEEALDNNKEAPPPPPLRTDDQYVADQLENFRSLYGSVAGFSMAEAYLECILSLATSGDESSRVNEVMEAGVYDESYRRVMGVLQSVGVELEKVESGSNDDDDDKEHSPKKRIAPKLVDQDICWSMMDNIQLRKERQDRNSNDKTALNDDGGRNNNNKDRLGGVLLSAEEPTMTRQLNVLSNIVLRALLFGGDQELLVLSETLEADKPAFVERWYPEDSAVAKDNEGRPGVQYLNCLVSVLQTCYREGVLQSLDPPLALTRSYGNAYERLVASLIELGSGYIKPPVATVQSMPIPRTAQEELGRFAVWETTFRKQQQVSDLTSFPEDMEGRWEVQDEIGGKTIGISTIALDPQGKVSVAPPMQGLSWRLDPGPTHLDTCTFQVLSKDDGTILQYRGFIDRGARLEARFSKRPICIRGSVMFQMRDGDVATTGEYWKDMMLPINYRTGTTKFVMTKLVE